MIGLLAFIVVFFLGFIALSVMLWRDDKQRWEGFRKNPKRALMEEHQDREMVGKIIKRSGLRRKRKRP